jgi:hypothetical protein
MFEWPSTSLLDRSREIESETSMPAHPRCELVDESEVGSYHCVARCVRRAFLCGDDPISGQNFDHRRTWIRDRLEALAAIFGIEVISFAVMSNHLHVILRTRPDLATAWLPAEVVRRWRELFPTGKLAGLAVEVLPALEVVEEWRSRLSSLSWFMRCLNEPIARDANREDRCTGRFWEGRFSSLRLLDEAAVLACSVYVDLNPIRAGVAEVPEASHWTSAYERITARQMDVMESVSPTAAAPTDQDGWMAPIPLSGDSEVKATRNAGRRASNRGVFEMSLDEYLSVVDWTGRQLHPGKRGAISAELPPILARLARDSSSWLKCIRGFGRSFRTAAGAVASMSAHASRLGRRFLRGIGMSRLAFG